MQICADNIAGHVLSTFNALPSRAKPRFRREGEREWTVLSGIVLCCDASNTIDCVSLGTGMRCLPASKIPLARGRCLHDWHAEILAIRSFNLFLIEECARLAKFDNYRSQYLRIRHKSELSKSSFQPFSLREGIRIFLYSSEAPCGDASMEISIASQLDPTPWPEIPSGSSESRARLEGRGHFSRVGEVRRKPSRGDAPISLSKSCSDKLALKQCTSLLSSLTSLLIDPEPAYLESLIMPKSQCIEVACTRAFGSAGRMGNLITESGAAKSLNGGYSFHPFTVRTTSREFEWCRPRRDSPIKVVGSNVSAMWTPRRQEVIIGGRIQGHTLASPRGASFTSNFMIWSLVRDILVALQIFSLSPPNQVLNYNDVKSMDLLEARRRMKNEVRNSALKNWVRNTGDAAFALEEFA